MLMQAPGGCKTCTIEISSIKESLYQVEEHNIQDKFKDNLISD